MLCAQMAQIQGTVMGTEPAPRDSQPVDAGSSSWVGGAEARSAIVLLMSQMWWLGRSEMLLCTAQGPMARQ